MKLLTITSSSVQNNRGQDKSYQPQPLASVDIYSGYHKKPNLINNCFVIIYTSKEKMTSKHSLVSEIIDNLFLLHIKICVICIL